MCFESSTGRTSSISSIATEGFLITASRASIAFSIFSIHSTSIVLEILLLARDTSVSAAPTSIFASSNGAHSRESVLNAENALLLSSSKKLFNFKVPLCSEFKD